MSGYGINSPGRIYVFDLDRTLADTSHREHYVQATPKRWTEFFACQPYDTPILPTCRLLNALAFASNEIWVLTARPEAYREVTTKWLERHGLWQYISRLIMRPDGNREDDDMLKPALLLEQLEADCAVPHDVAMVFEDRTRIVKAFRAHGFMCAQVAPGDF